MCYVQPLVLSRDFDGAIFRTISFLLDNPGTNTCIWKITFVPLWSIMILLLLFVISPSWYHAMHFLSQCGS